MTIYIKTRLLSLTRQQWTIGPIDREIVPIQAEMLHPTKSQIGQAEMEKNKNI
jgi:hypothetical protein